MIFKKYTQIISILVIVSSIYLGFFSIMPNATLKKEVPLTEFSSERALVHLKQIAEKPHFTGSTAHEFVVDYIKTAFEKMGLEVEIQEQMAINKKWRAATRAKNIIARIKGTEKGKGLLLLTHYDSNPHSSLGASDAGSGVVTILEGVRAFLATGTQPKNDIYICITDAEELGLLGANAFVNHHPWAKNVGLVLNFEARGSGGPSYMLLETNGGNKKLIEAFNEAHTPYPVANSLMYSIYKMLPNDTDLTVFREEGDISGFNFAFIGDHFDYHTVQDSFSRLDINTLKHQASYLMPLLNYFSSHAVEDFKSETDYVYFNVPYLGLIFYPFSFVTPIFIGCVFLFLVLLFMGISKKVLSFSGILKGFIPFVFSLVFSVLLAIYGWKLVLKIHPQYNDILHGFTYNGYYYIALFSFLTLTICFWIYKKYIQKYTYYDLIIAPIFFWLLLNGGIAFYLKGASFFILPPLVLLVMLVITIFSDKKEGSVTLFTLLSVPVLALFAPLVKMFPVGLGLKMLAISTFFTVMLFGVLIPVVHQYKNKNLMFRLMLFGSVLTLVLATSFSGYNEERREPNSILYMLDTTTNEAYWTSYNTKVDSFTVQFLGENPLPGSFDDNTTASKYNTGIKWHQKAEIKTFDLPSIQIASDTIIGESRIIQMQIESLRSANRIEMLTKTPIQFKSFEVNGVAIPNNGTDFVFSVQKGTVMSYFMTAPHELIEVEFSIAKEQQLSFDFLEAKYDLFENPQFKIKPRTPVMMPMPFVLNDATVIKTSINL